MSGQERKCSKCRRPLSNHPGKNGPTCSNPPLTGTETEKEGAITGHTGSATGSASPSTNTEVYMTPSAVADESFNFTHSSKSQGQAVPTAVTAAALPATQTVTVTEQSPTVTAPTTNSTGGTTGSGAVQTTSVSPSVATLQTNTQQVVTGLTTQVEPSPLMHSQQHALSNGTFLTQSQTVPIWSTNIQPSMPTIGTMGTMATMTQAGPTMSISQVLQHMNLLQNQVTRLQNQAALNNFNTQPINLATFVTGPASNASQLPVTSPAQAGLTTYVSSATPHINDYRYFVAPNINQQGYGVIQAQPAGGAVAAQAGWQAGLVAGPPPMPQGWPQQAQQGSVPGL